MLLVISLLVLSFFSCIHSSRIINAKLQAHMDEIREMDRIIELYGEEAYWTRERLTELTMKSFKNSGLVDPDDWKSCKKLAKYGHDTPKITDDPYKAIVFVENKSQVGKVQEAIKKLDNCVECFVSGYTTLHIMFKGNKLYYAKLCEILNDCPDSVIDTNEHPMTLELCGLRDTSDSKDSKSR